MALPTTMTPYTLGGNPQISAQTVPFGSDFVALEATATTLPGYFNVLQMPQFWPQIDSLLEEGITQKAGVFGHIMSPQRASDAWFQGLYGGNNGAQSVIPILNSTNIQVKVPIVNRMVSNLTLNANSVVASGANATTTCVFNTAIGSSMPQPNNIYRGTILATGVTQEFFIVSTTVNQSTNTVAAVIAPIDTTVTLAVMGSATKCIRIGHLAGTTTFNQQNQSKMTTIYQNASIGKTEFSYEWASANITQQTYWGIQTDALALTNPFVSGLGITAVGNYYFTWTVDFLHQCVNYMIDVEAQLVWNPGADSGINVNMGLYAGEDVMWTKGLVPSVEEVGQALSYTPGNIGIYNFLDFQTYLCRNDFTMINKYMMYTGVQFDNDFQNFSTNYPVRPLDMSSLAMKSDLRPDNSLGDRVLSYGIRAVALSAGVSFWCQRYGQFSSTSMSLDGVDAEYAYNAMFLPVGKTDPRTINNQEYQVPTLAILTQGTKDPRWQTVNSKLPAVGIGGNPFAVKLNMTSTQAAAEMLGIYNWTGSTPASGDNISYIWGEQRFGLFPNNLFATAMMSPA